MASSATFKREQTTLALLIYGAMVDNSSLFEVSPQQNRKYMNNTDKEQWFWNIIANAKEDRELLRTILMEFSKDNIVAFQEIFVDLAAELQCKPFTDYIEESEDGVEDVSHWVVSKGRTYYEKILKHPELIPYSIKGNDSDTILYGIADEVCLDKYNDVTGIY